VAAPNFGDCVCGRPKGEHGLDAIINGGRGSTARRSSAGGGGEGGRLAAGLEWVRQKSFKAAGKARRPSVRAMTPGEVTSAQRRASAQSTQLSAGSEDAELSSSGPGRRPSLMSTHL
jgi:hypothetical protein